MNLSFRREGELHHPINSWDLDDGNTIVIGNREYYYNNKDTYHL